MEAQELFERCINSIPDAQSLREHTERVVALCAKFADKFPDDVDRKLLLDSAWLHDIAKYSAGKKHNEPEKVRALISNLNLGDEVNNIDAVVEIIAAHKGDFAPTKNGLECAVLRICDKLDKFEKGKADAEKRCNKSMQKIQESGVLDNSELEKLCSFFKSELHDKKQRNQCHMV